MEKPDNNKEKVEEKDQELEHSKPLGHFSTADDDTLDDVNTVHSNIHKQSLESSDEEEVHVTSGKIPKTLLGSSSGDDDMEIPLTSGRADTNIKRQFDKTVPLLEDVPVPINQTEEGRSDHAIQVNFSGEETAGSSSHTDACSPHKNIRRRRTTMPIIIEKPDETKESSSSSDN